MTVGSLARALLSPGPSMESGGQAQKEHLPQKTTALETTDETTNSEKILSSGLHTPVDASHFQKPFDETR